MLRRSKICIKTLKSKHVTQLGPCIQNKHQSGSLPYKIKTIRSLPYEIKSNRVPGRFGSAPALPARVPQPLLAGVALPSATCFPMVGNLLLSSDLQTRSCGLRSGAGAVRIGVWGHASAADHGRGGADRTGDTGAAQIEPETPGG
jgi:hypothetical protein